MLWHEILPYLELKSQSRQKLQSTDCTYLPHLANGSHAEETLSGSSQLQLALSSLGSRPIDGTMGRFSPENLNSKP